MEFKMWLENDQLSAAISDFPFKDKCNSASYAMGSCDGIAVEFINHAKKFGLQGTLLALDNPTKEPTRGWKPWGGDWRKTGAAISHYISYFPSLQLGVDFTARQFWDDAKVPEILTLDQIKKLWHQFPYNMDDSRDHEDYE